MVLGENSSYARFKVMPVLAIRSVGEPIRIGDKIQLESTEVIGRSLHVASSRPASPVVRDSSATLECNAAVVGTPVMVLAFMRQSNAKKEAELVQGPVRSGDIVQLFHQATHSYVAAEGSFLETNARENVHLRLRVPDNRRPNRLKPPTSAISVSKPVKMMLWQTMG